MNNANINKYEVITIGSATRDVFLKTPDFQVVKDDKYRTGRAGCFVLGAKMEVPEAVITTGGGGTNTAVGFSRQGFKTACIGRVGNDSIGKEIIEELKNEKIDTFFQIDKEYPSAYSTILVSGDGERTILERRGASDYLTEKEIDFENLDSDWLYIDSLAGRVELLEALLDWAGKKNIKVAMNPDKRIVKMGEKLYKHLDRIDIFSVNEDEAAYVAGMDYKEENEPEIFKKLDKAVRGLVLMTKGPRGVEVSDGKTRYFAPVPDSPVVERTGAGDSFGSGFVSGYIHSGGDIVTAMQLGTANASSVVAYFGAKRGHLKKGDWGKWPKVEVVENKI